MSDSPNNPPQPPPLANAGIPAAHLLYAGVTLVLYIAIWDHVGVGIILSAVVVVLWGIVFSSANRPQSFVAVFCLILFLWFGLFSLTGYMPREAARRSSCKNNLKQIMLALHNYHEVYDAFPPAYMTDENGEPMHSWRVMILPYLDLEAQSLYEEYDYSEPWDSPENLKLLDNMPYQYSCPSHAARSDKQNMTSYMVVVGPETAWPGSSSTRIPEFEDGTSNTMMVIESHTAEIPWTAPQDLSLEQAQKHLASTDFESFGGHRHETFFYTYLDGHNVALADGSVQFADIGLDPNLAGELFTINDGRPDPEWNLSDNGAVQVSRVRWDNVIRFTISLVWALLPLPWVWLNPTGSRTG